MIGGKGGELLPGVGADKPRLSVVGGLYMERSSQSSCSRGDRRTLTVVSLLISS